MAKSRQRIAKGLSVSDITRMSMQEFEKYTPTQQREIVSRLGSAANKRFRNLESKDIATPATIFLEQSGGKISVKGKTGEELKQELFRAKQFLKSSLSTVKGYKKLQKAIKEEIERSGKVYKESKSLGQAIAYYDTLVDIDPTLRAKKDKYKVQEFIAELIDEGKNEEQILKEVSDYLNEGYLQTQKDYNATNVSFGEKIENDIPSRYRRRKRNRRG